MTVFFCKDFFGSEDGGLSRKIGRGRVGGFIGKQSYAEGKCLRRPGDRVSFSPARVSRR